MFVLQSFKDNVCKGCQRLVCSNTGAAEWAGTVAGGTLVQVTGSWPGCSNRGNCYQSNCNNCFPLIGTNHDN